MTTLLIARHGNTFEQDQTPVRVGRTDMPLSSSGRTQAVNLGNYLKINNLHPAKVYCSNLKRTQETASIALKTAGLVMQPQILSMFDEIDYGPDEGKTNAEVIDRIGEIALHDWENLAVAPEGWLVDTNQIIQDWQSFAKDLVNTYPNDKILVITSNGIARFAPYLTNDFFGFTQHHNIKLATGAIGSLTYKAGEWKADYWNQVPQKSEM
jgi:2,3-bisphosphoglycerate-dependent phosphoglycerate mutase